MATSAALNARDRHPADDLRVTAQGGPENACIAPIAAIRGVMKTIRQLQLTRGWGRRARVGDIVIFNAFGAWYLAGRVLRKQPLGKMHGA
jgi:hypothetical protein